MTGLISFIFNWIDFLIHLYIQIRATMNAVIFVAKKSSLRPTTVEEIIQRRRTKNGTIARFATQYKRGSHQSPRFSPIANKINHFKKIPNEILIITFKFMEQGDLYHCSTVTKNWNKLITPILWHSPIPNRPILSCLPAFGIIDKNKKISHQHQISHISPAFPLHLSRYGHAVKSLDLSQITSHVTDCTLRHIVHSCPHLSSLNLSHCRLITNEGLRYLTGHSKITNNLTTLALQNCRQITDVGLSYLKETCKSLETLHLGGCSRISDIGVIELMTASGSSIRRINLSDCSRVTGSTIRAIARLCGTRLEWLDIARTTKAIRHSDLVNLVTCCPNISRLNLSLKKPKSLMELRNQLSLRRSQLFQSHDDQEDIMVYSLGRYNDYLLQEQQENNDIMMMEEIMNQTANNTGDDDENPLTELLDLLNRFNIQPTLTTRSAQHQQSIVEQQRLRDAVSNHTIETIAINLKKLEHLNLSYWTCLNDKAIHTLSVHSRCLTCLNLIGCSSVTKKMLRYLTDLCERISTCITLNDLMISPTKRPTDYSYENSRTNRVWMDTTLSVSSSSSSEERSQSRKSLKA